MVSSSASRSRSNRRSPARRTSPPAEPKAAVADATMDKSKEGASAPRHRLDGQDGKRSKGSGAVANRRRKGEPGTWQCPECSRVINDNPSAKQQHWDSIYCQATRLCNQHGGSWWEWKTKVEKNVHKETWHLKENLLIFSCIFVFFLFWAVNEKSNKKEEVQTRITNIFHVFLP